MDFYEKLKELKIYDIDKILKSFQNQKNVFVFVNLIKNSYENFEYFCKNLEIKTKIFEIFADEIKIKLYEINNFDKLKLTKNNEFNQGFFYILNPSSVFSPILLNPKENEKILDMCASPGGKTIILANLMNKKGYLSAIENDKNRFFIMQKNLKNFEILDNKFCRIFLKDARNIAKNCPLIFDKILLDAPCSSYSHFNENFKEKSQKEIKSIAKLQKQLLNSALSVLKKSGEIVYSTCTFFKEENEEILENALKSKFNIEILPINLKAKNLEIFEGQSLNTKNAKRISPNEIFDAFFITKIKKY